VFLVDDVVTTGTTADACAHALRAAQVEVVAVLSAARGGTGTNERNLGAIQPEDGEGISPFVPLRRA
jgi:orotate phosphoribosyltransferase